MDEDEGFAKLRRFIENHPLQYSQVTKKDVVFLVRPKCSPR